MRAVGVVKFGGPQAFEVVELPDRHAGPGEMRIRVHAAAVNPTDTFTRNGARAEMQGGHPPPYVPGMDAAGVLDEIGEGVETDLLVGDHVMAIVVPLGPHGAYTESLVVPAESVVKVPKGATDAEASTLPMNGLTARLALDVLNLRRGQTIAVTGAAGAFGGYVVQLAKAEGLTVIGDASPVDEQLVRHLGADFVVARGNDVADRILEIAPDGVDGLADGALMHTLVLRAVRDGGGLAAVRPFVGDSERGVAIHTVRVRDYAKERAKLDRLRQQAEDGLITLRVAKTFPPEETAEAHRLLEAGGVRGRLVIEF